MQGQQDCARDPSLPPEFGAGGSFLQGQGGGVIGGGGGGSGDTPGGSPVPRRGPLSLVAVEVGEIVRSSRERMGLTLTALAQRAGCAKSYLSMIENGRRRSPASREVLSAIERALQLPAGTLLSAAHMQQSPASFKKQLASMGTSQRAAAQLADLRGPGAIDQAYRSGQLQRLIEKLDPGAERKRAKDENAVMTALPVEVPLINSVAAGYPCEFTDLSYPARVADEYVRTPDIRDADAFAARVIGDSMEPAYVEGDIVVFSPAKPVKSGMDCFVRLERDAQTTFKRVFVEEENAAARGVASDVPGSTPDGSMSGSVSVSGKIRLQPLNAKYAPRVLEREEVAGMYAAVTVMRQIG